MQQQVSFLAIAVAVAVSAYIFAPKPIEDTGLPFDKMFDVSPVATTAVIDQALEVASIETAAGDEAPTASEQASEPAAVPEISPTHTPDTSVAASEPAALAAPAASGIVLKIGCDQGLPTKGEKPLFFFHEVSQISWGGTDGEIHLDPAKGKVSFDGKLYDLQALTLYEKEIALSGVTYPMKLRFDYVGDDKSHVTIDVPIQKGAANLTIEKILSADKGMIDPTDLIPADHSYAIAGDCQAMGNQMREFIMTTPLQVSAEQIEKISKQPSL